jgi:hypothetical protein
MKETLKDFLFRRYGGRGHKPFPDTLTDRPFRVDAPFAAKAVGVTGVFVTFKEPDGEAFVLELIGFPMNPSIQQAVKKCGGRFDNSHQHAHISITLTSQQYPVLRVMAKTFRQAHKRRQPAPDAGKCAAWELAAEAIEGLACVVGSFLSLTILGAVQRDNQHKPTGPSNAPWPSLS